MCIYTHMLYGLTIFNIQCSIFFKLSVTLLPTSMNTNNPMMMNTSTSRKKRTEIKKIEEVNSRQVTFSKRRCGVFKKASELCILTGAEAAIFCESSGGRVYAFGHPSVESIIDKYVGDGSLSESSQQKNVVAVNEAAPCIHEELRMQYKEISKQLEAEKNKSKNLIGENNNCGDDIKVEEGGSLWWKQSFDHFEMEELEKYTSSMEELMNKLILRADDLRLIKSSSSLVAAYKNLNSKDDGLHNQFSANENVSTKVDDGILNQFYTNKNSYEFLANEDDDDDEMKEIFANFEIPSTSNNMLVSNLNLDTGNELLHSRTSDNLLVPDDYSTQRRIP